MMKKSKSHPESQGYEMSQKPLLDGSDPLKKSVSENPGEVEVSDKKKDDDEKYSPYTGINKVTKKDDTFMLKGISPCLGFAAFLDPTKIKGGFKITSQYRSELFMNCMVIHIA